MSGIAQLEVEAHQGHAVGAGLVALIQVAQVIRSRRADSAGYTQPDSAVSKALGLGAVGYIAIAAFLALVGLSAPDAPPRLESWNGPGRRPTVRFADLDLAPGYLACVARLGRSPIDADVAELPIT